MGTPIWTVTDIPVYAIPDDMEQTGQEHGNLAVTVTPSTLWMWEEPGGWQPVTSTTTTDLRARVTALEARLACLADCLTVDVP